MQTHFFNSKTFQYLTPEELIQQEKQIQLLEREPERRVFYVDVGNLPKDEVKELLVKPQTKRK